MQVQGLMLCTKGIFLGPCLQSATALGKLQQEMQRMALCLIVMQTTVDRAVSTSVLLQNSGVYKHCC